VPVTQSAAIDLLGHAALGEPAWHWSGLRSGAVFPVQLGFVLVGTAGSLGLTQAMAQRDYASGRSAVPWMILLGVLAAAAIWILMQPMDMRGLAGAA